LSDTLAYEVAISVSDDCLDIARFVSALLRSKGYRTFLYEDDLAMNWGLHLEHLLESTYGRTQNIVILAGCTYFQNRWSSLEADIAARRLAVGSARVIGFWFCNRPMPKTPHLALVNAKQLQWSDVGLIIRHRLELPL
jgi:hypothetical protein